MSKAPARDEVLWEETAVSRPFIAATAAFMVVIAMITVLLNDTAMPEKQIHGAGWFGFFGILAFAFLMVVEFLWVTIQVRRDGFFLAYGPLRWPRQKISWSAVAQVQRINVNPLAWGGWGYRWIPGKKGTAVVVRKGPGLKFELSGDKVFVITVNDVDNALHAIERALHPESEKHCDHDHH